jgi:hypothetical protein
MGFLGSFIVIALGALLFALALRFALLLCGRWLQKRLGFSDFALTGVVITVPVIGYVAAFMAGMAWLLR